MLFGVSHKLLLLSQRSMQYPKKRLYPICGRHSILFYNRPVPFHSILFYSFVHVECNQRVSVRVFMLLGVSVHLAGGTM